MIIHRVYYYCSRCGFIQLALVCLSKHLFFLYCKPNVYCILVTAECLSVIKYIVLSLYITSKRVLKKEEQRKRNPQVNNLRGRGDERLTRSIFLTWRYQRTLDKANLYAKIIQYKTLINIEDNYIIILEIKYY